MNCENIKEKLSLYIDNLLDPDEAGKIREHIESCDSCRAYYNHLLKLGAMVDGFVISDKEEYWEAQRDKVMDRIEQAESEKVIEVQSIRKRSRFYKYLAGIQVDPDYPGWEFFSIKPYVLGDLAYAEGSVQTVRGEVRSSWKRAGDTFSLEVALPVNCRAAVSLPFTSDPAVLIEESGRPVWREGRFQEGGEGIEEACLEDGRVTIKLGSGVYSFVIKGQ